MIVQHCRLEGAAWFLLFALGTRIHTLLFRIAAPIFAAVGCEFAVVWKVCVTLGATFAASFAPSNSQLLCLCTAVSMFERLRMFVFFAYGALQRKLSGSTIHTQRCVCRVRIRNRFAEPTMLATCCTHNQLKSLVQFARCTRALVLQEMFVLPVNSANIAFLRMPTILLVKLL